TGPRVAAFEKALSERFGGRPVRALTSATAAMQVALELLGIGPGDEVVIPAQSFFVTGNVVERSGASAVFVDVNLGSRNIDQAPAGRHARRGACGGQVQLLRRLGAAGPRAARAPGGLVPRPRAARAALLRVPRGRRPAHARATAAARQPRAQLEHVRSAASA